MGPLYGWRFPFICVSLPAMLSAILTYMFASEPERGSKEKNISIINTSIKNDEKEDEECEESQLHYHLLSNNNNNNIINEEEDIISLHHNEESTTTTNEWFNATMNILRTKTFFLLYLQSVPGCLASSVNTYLNDYLSQDRGMSIQKATTTLLFLGIGITGGHLTGGFFCDFFHRNEKTISYSPILAGCSIIFACIPFLIMFNIVDADTPLLLLMIESILAGIATGVKGPIVQTILTNVTHPNERGQAYVILNTFGDLGKYNLSLFFFFCLGFTLCLCMHQSFCLTNIITCTHNIQVKVLALFLWRY